MNDDVITSVEGTPVPVRGNDIDTDRIIPARFMKCVTFDGLGEFAFNDDREQNPDHTFNKSQYRNGSILIVADNFGCGSSREHAPQSLMRWGMQAIIGRSFSEIFYGNCSTIGIPALTVDAEQSAQLFDIAEAHPDVSITIDIASAEIRAGDTVVQGQMPQSLRDAFTQGTWNTTQMLLAGGDAIGETAARLTY